jgi:hypothetical protein
MYDHPEEFGLVLLNAVKLDTDGLEGICTGTWDAIALWRKSYGVYLIGADRSCDCQTPFENTRVDQLTEILPYKDDVYAFVSDVWQTKPMGTIINAVEVLTRSVVA